MTRRVVTAIDDLRHFHEDAFQIISDEHAGVALFILVMTGIILEPFFR